jgi:hypothetical protein
MALFVESRLSTNGSSVVLAQISSTVSEEAAAFYRRLGFDVSPLDPMILMVTLADLRAASP